MNEIIILIIYLLLVFGLIFSFSTIGIYLLAFIMATINFIGKQLDKGHIWVLGIVGIIFILIAIGLLYLVRRINYG